MNGQVILPSSTLADYIRFFWFAEGSATQDTPFVHHAFAYPCPELVFCYKGQFQFQTAFEAEKKLFPGIYGQTQTFGKVASTTDFGVFGFYLFPHALPQLFGLPANELTNESADIKSLCGKEGEILEEEIMLAKNNHQRIELVSDFLTRRLKNAKTTNTHIPLSIKTIICTQQVGSISALVNHSFLSIRQFERRFKEFSGFSPKLFLRITRFNSLLNRSFQDKSFAQIAYEHGYYDQSHFIHDFKNFSGYNPKEYFRQDTVFANDRGTVG
ncbi:MAG: helix-turn-helix domain-containing protein [Olivibacter sp.]|nr:helix-turn-helix domain-containing protein [Olivibacter sp. UJ_SKK_5.1]